MGHIRLDVLFCNRCGCRCVPPDYTFQKLRNGTTVHLCGECESWWMEEMNKLEKEMYQRTAPDFPVVELHGAIDLCTTIDSDMEEDVAVCHHCKEEFGLFATIFLEEGKPLCGNCRVKPRCKNQHCNEIVENDNEFCSRCLKVE